MYRKFLKRPLDFLAALCGLLALSPLMVVLAILVRIKLGSPVLFRQPRPGRHGKPFDLFKFRTMKEERDSHGQLLPDADRLTPFGRFLRSTSLDELPELWNVLKGEMSLVGPRPELPELVQHYQPWQRMRFAVPQGLTGWWQVNGRSDKPMHLHTDEDLYYIQNYSLWLDLQILIKTVLVILRGKGAY